MYQDLDLRIIRKTFQKVIQQQENFTFAFYNNLFAAYPEFKPLFSPAIHTQGGKLRIALMTIMESLKEDNPAFQEYLAYLGQKHEAIGIEPEYFEPFKQVLLQTFAQFLKEEWTEEVAELWEIVFLLVEQHMLQGYYQESVES